MTPPAKSQIYDELLEICASLETSTDACLEQRSGLVSTAANFEAGIGPGPLSLPWNFAAIRAGLSNHAALQFDAHVATISKAIERLNQIINNHLGALQGIYAPRVEFEWLTAKGIYKYALKIDNISMHPGNPLSDEEFCESVAAALLRHASLPLEGWQETYYISNLPITQRTSIEVMAPSEGLAVARVGALLGMNAEELWGKRVITVIRLASFDEVKADAEKILADIGLP